MTHPALEAISRIFAERGAEAYGSEPVTQLEHALQCATLAAESGANDALVAAALLHDIGCLLGPAPVRRGPRPGPHDGHDERGHAWLCQHFGAEVTEPVRLHVLAKRYLCSVDDGYAATLSPTSFRGFIDQGGCMDAEEVAEFEAERYHRDAVALRRWDDLARVPGQYTHGLAELSARIERLLG